jgi:hypothetical protein
MKQMSEISGSFGAWQDRAVHVEVDKKFHCKKTGDKKFSHPREIKARQPTSIFELSNSNTSTNAACMRLYCGVTIELSSKVVILIDVNINN